LLAVREIERTGDWALPLSYFAFWTVRLGGWLPRFDRCSQCGAEFGSGAAYYAPWEPGLLCEKCRRPGMKPLHLEARQLAERFTGERLDQMVTQKTSSIALSELREAALNWIEHHSDRKLKTRALLETT
jgi:recombinational DNA repair protein (RecF pathway)